MVTPGRPNWVISKEMYMSKLFSCPNSCHVLTLLVSKLFSCVNCSRSDLHDYSIHQYDTKHTSEGLAL